MTAYQPFPISNWRVNLNESVEPWLLPREAFQSVLNAHTYRGVIEKIDGYTLYAQMSYRKTIVLSPTPNGTTRTFTGSLGAASFTPSTTNFFGYGTLVLGTSAETFTYDGDGTFPIINLIGSSTGTGTVNVTTNAVSLTFNTAPPSGTYSNVNFTWDYAAPGTQAIMGIEQYFEANGTQEIMIFDQKRVGIIVNNYGFIAENILGLGVLQGVSEIPHDFYQAGVIVGDGTTTTFNAVGTNPVAQGTFRLYGFDYLGNPIPATNPTNLLANVIMDNGVGGITGPNVASGSINYSNGSFTITFTTAPLDPADETLGGTIATIYDLTYGAYGNLFTGSISNFFSLTNYAYCAFFTNSVDPIMYYDGNTIKYLNTSLEVQLATSSSGVPTNYDIKSCLHVFTNRERLLLINVNNDGFDQPNYIYWSTPFNPFNFTNNERLPAPTSEPIRAIGFINSDLVVRFANSERVFRFTDDFNSPFRFDSTNNLWACDAPYSTINYDSWFSSVGRPAIVGSDAVNVKRVDEIIPDFTDPSRIATQTPIPYMNQESIGQCFGQRFDDIKEGWLCYNSSPQDEDTITASDNVLAFNYLDGTYAIYTFPFSCLGFGRVINVPTWGTDYRFWNDAATTWDSFQLQQNSLVDLAGDQFDNVYQLNTGNTLGDGVTPVVMSVITKNFNPFIEEGQLCRFGYLDLFVTADVDTFLRIQFYINDQLYIDSTGTPQGYWLEKTINFKPTDAMSPNTNQIKVWKRIYVGAVGKTHTIRFYQNNADFCTDLDQPVNIHAMVLYMKPAGRIFN